MHRGRVATHILRTAETIDWAGVLWVGPIRAGCVTAITFAIAMGHPAAVVPATIGSLLVALVDPSGTFGLRFRAMALTALIISVTAAVALSVADSLPLHLVVAAAVAFVFGYIGICGPRAGVAGMVGLVMFAVFSGTPEPIGDVVPTTIYVVIGASIQVIVVCLPTLFRRLEEIRSEVFLAYRALGYSLKRDARGIPALTAAARINVARERIPLSGAEGASRAWLEQLVEACDHARVGFFALTAEDELHNDEHGLAVGELVHSASTLSLRIAAALHVPLLRRRIAPALADFQRVADMAEANLPAKSRPIVRSIRRDLERGAALAQGAWPIGRKAECGPMLRIPPAALVGPQRLVTLARPFVMHGARLAAAFTVGTLIAETIFPIPHAYWLPMTVAWLTKPGLNDSAVRLVQRFCGTVVGVTIVSIVLSLVWSDPFAIVVIGVSMTVIVAFVVPNYLIATEGVTVFILTLFYFDGSPLVETVPARVLATGAAAVVVWLIMILWRPAIADRVLLELVEQARMLRLYALACRGGDLKIAETARIRFVQARIAAGIAITVSENEMAEHRVQEDAAEAIHRDLIGASAVPVIVEIAGDPELKACITDAALASLAGLAERLAAMQEAGGNPPARSETGAEQRGPFAQHIEDAHGRLEALAART